MPVPDFHPKARCLTGYCSIAVQLNLNTSLGRGHGRGSIPPRYHLHQRAQRYASQRVPVSSAQQQPFPPLAACPLRQCVVVLQPSCCREEVTSQTFFYSMSRWKILPTGRNPWRLSSSSNIACSFEPSRWEPHVCDKRIS